MFEPLKEEGASNISSSEDNILAKKSTPPMPPSKPYTEDIKDNGRLFLSSLPSIDDEVDDIGRKGVAPSSTTSSLEGRLERNI